MAQEVFPGAATDVHDTLHYPMLDGTLHVEPTTMEQIRGVRSRAQRRLMRDVLQGDKYRSWVESRPQALDAFLATLHDPHVRGRFGAWAVVDHGEKVRRLYAQRGRILFVAERARPTQPVCGTLLLDSGGGLLEYQFNGFAGGGHASADLMAERSAALELALVQTRASTGSHASTSGTRAPSSTTASSPTSVAWGAPSSRCAGRRPSASTSVRRGVSRSSPGTRCSPARRARGRRCSATTTRRRRARREVPQERQGGEERDEEYGRALVCVLPYTGGFAGYPATLAMASGVPVIATRRAGLPEHLGDAGVWAAPDDPEGLAAAITRLLRDDAERRRVAEAGRARAEHALSWDAVARSTMACYEKAVRFKHATAA